MSAISIDSSLDMLVDGIRKCAVGSNLKGTSAMASGMITKSDRYNGVQRAARTID